MRRLRTTNISSSERSILLTRTRWLRWIFFVCLMLVLARLAYWQLYKGSELTQESEAQYERKIVSSGNRGSINFVDGSPLVTNQRVYRLFATPHLMTDLEKDQTAQTLSQILSASLSATVSTNQASASAVSSEQIRSDVLAKLHRPNARWVNLYQPIPEKLKEILVSSNLPNIGFDVYSERYYPEASLAAHLTGFVGKTAIGEDVGYFGLEGALDSELQPRTKSKLVLADALGFALFAGDGESKSLDGRSVTTTLRRDIQYLIERKLEKGIQQYGAEAGEIIVMNPHTGEVLGLATWPQYDPALFANYPAALYKNPSITETFEPGSTFKIITVATGIDSGAITPDTICTHCSGPRQFGTYTLKTWNEEYHPNITMTDALAKSDNVAMIFAAERIGAETFREYVKKFGIGDALDIDLQEDTSTPFPDAFRPVELATASFGQGISTTSLQLIRAVSVIANQGVKVNPHIVASVFDPIAKSEVTTKNDEGERIISTQTAAQVTQMMVYAAQKGEAQWVTSKTHLVAGKTGTAQIANKGGYEESQTLANYIGFAPPNNPQFIMLVKLTRPQSSPWAAETAAPLWYDTAQELYVLLGMSPDRFESTPSPKQ